MKRIRVLSLVFLFLLGMSFTLQFAVAQTAAPRGIPPSSEGSNPLIEILKSAPPAPAPKPMLGPVLAPTEAGPLVTFDPVTKTAGSRPAITPNTFTAPVKDAPSAAPAPIPQSGPGAAPPAGSALDRAVGVTPAASALTTMTTPYGYPWSTIYKLLVRFSASGSDYYYVCSTASASSFHVITAGHCVYNHDIRNDGSNIAGWAQEAWLWPAQTDVVDPIGTPEFPYGVAKSTLFTTFTGWMNNSDFNYDFGFITLDRRIGDRTGWMGRDPNTPYAGLNFSGYPVETPYVPANTYFQYYGYGAVTNYTDYRISLDAYVYGGHSGGPEWYYTTDRYIQGVNSTSNRAGYAEGSRYTTNVQSNLANTITTDQSARPPVDRPELVEYVFDNTSKGLQTLTVAPGGQISVTCNAYNVGYVTAPTVWLDFYLSTNTTISTSDYYIGWDYVSNLQPNSYSVKTCNLTVPSTVPPGTYYVGYMLSSSLQEYNTDDNTVVITSQLLAVNGAPGSFGLYSPASGATGVSLTPTLSWDSSARASSYDVYLGTSSSLQTLVTNVTGTSYALTTLSPGTTYYWKIVAKNAYGSYTAGPWSFTTSSPPGTFYLTQPVNNATAVPLNPTLTWAVSAGASSYDVYIGTSTAFTSPVTNTTGASYNPGPLSANTKYYWKVVAKNSFGTATAGPWAFTTGAVPGAFSLTSPVNLANGVSTTPTLTWGASTGSPAPTYAVYLGTSSTLTTPLTSITGTSYTVLTPLTTGTTYYWKIVAQNSFGTYTAGPWAFTVGSAAPGAFTLTSPSNGAVGVLQAPTLIWGTSSGATSYDVYFGSSSTLTTPVKNVTASGYAPGTLTRGATYYWKIVAKNSAGTYTAGPWWFRVSSLPLITSLTPASGAGMTAVLTGVYTDPDGPVDDARVLINSSVVYGAGCYVRYAAGKLYLANDTGGTWLGGFAPGAASTASNSQCTLNGTGSATSTTATTRTLTLNLQFKTAFTGAKTVWLAAVDTASLSTGWVSKGTWYVSAATPVRPAVVSLSPSTGGGTAQAFTATFSDANGGDVINDARILVNSSLVYTSGCYVRYATGLMYLLNDTNTGWLGGFAPGSTGSATNSQCTLTGTGSAATVSGNNRILVANLQFKTAFTGAKTVWLAGVESLGNLSTGWISKGTWTVGTLPPAPTGPSPANGATAVSVNPTLSWGSATGATSYDVYLGTSPYPSLVGNVTGTTFSPGTLRANTTYFWRVAAKNGSGQKSSGIWRFTTARSAPGSIVNGGFETGTLSGWTVLGAASSAVTNAAKVGGTYSLLQTGGDGGVYQVISGFTPGVTYTVSAQVMSPNAGTGALYVDDGTGSGGASYGWSALPVSWSTYTVNFVATSTGNMRIHLLRTAGGGDVYWDNVGLTWVANTPLAAQRSGLIQPADWVTYGTAKAVASNGLAAVSLQGDAGGAYHDFAGLLPGHTYRVSARVSAAAGSDAMAGLWVNDSFGSNAAGGPMQPALAGGSTLVTVEFTATETGVARVHLNQTGGAADTLQWSDVSVQEVN